MVRKMRTNSKVGGKIKRKWGKIGAPHSKKRKRWTAKIGRKGGKARKKK